VRIDFRVRRDGLPDASRFAVCRFADGGLSGGRSDLVAITTDSGPISGAALYLLKRYYLDTREGVAGDPGPGEPSPIPAIPASLAEPLQHALVGLPRAGIYAVLAAAYALVFGLVGRINLAFGELAAIGAAAAGITAAALATGESSIAAGVGAALAVAAGAAALHGLVAGHVAFRLVSPRSGQAALIATLGLSIALMEYLRLAVGDRPPWIPSVWSEPIRLARAGEFVLTVTPVSVAVGAVGLAAALALAAAMRWSAFGRAWRAHADDPLAAALFGIDGARLLTRTLLLAGASAGLAGGLAALQFGALGFAGGFGLGLKALAAAILGGIGSVPGALAGGLAISGFETLWSAALPIDGRDVALYAALVLTIVLKGGAWLAAPSPGGAER
jgi:branched-chain amino acid transport system permease protein